MEKSSKSPKSLSEAIAILEKAAPSVAQDLKSELGHDYQQIKEALEQLQPHLQDLKQKAHDQAQATKKSVEAKVRENPWIAVGAIGLIAFFIGWLLGRDGQE